jgi:hypothetical protein
MLKEGDMQHQEMIRPTHFGVISRTCIFALVGMVVMFALV